MSALKWRRWALLVRKVTRGRYVALVPGVLYRRAGVVFTLTNGREDALYAQLHVKIVTDKHLIPALELLFRECFEVAKVAQALGGKATHDGIIRQTGELLLLFRPIYVDGAIFYVPIPDLFESQGSSLAEQHLWRSLGLTKEKKR